MSEEQILSAQPNPSPKKEVSTGVKVLLRILSILLCLCLCVSLLSTALILDFRLVTQKDTIRKMAGSMFSSPARTVHSIPMTAAMGAIHLDAPAETNEQTQDALVSWLYGTLKEQHGDELKVTQEQMQSFLDQSTTKEYLTEKIASYADDFINGTNNTTITSDELTWLIEENNAAIEAELGVKMDAAAQEQVLSFVEEMDIGEVIRTEVIEKVQNIPLTGGTADSPAAGSSFTVGDLMTRLQMVTSPTALILSIAINIFLIVALFFVNRMRLSATLCCAGISTTIMGGLLSLVTALSQLLSDLLGNAGSAISIAAGIIAPVHYGMLGLGIVLLIGAIVAKALRKKAASSVNS